MMELILIFGSIMVTIFLSMNGLMERATEHTIEYLRDELWFQEYLDNENYNQLIEKNRKVRRIICTINTNKMTKYTTYHNRQRKRIEDVMEKQIKVSK